jgi:hypothetical protein
MSEKQYGDHIVYIITQQNIIDVDITGTIEIMPMTSDALFPLAAAACRRHRHACPARARLTLFNLTGIQAHMVMEDMSESMNSIQTIPT